MVGGKSGGIVVSNYQIGLSLGRLRIAHVRSPIDNPGWKTSDRTTGTHAEIATEDGVSGVSDTCSTQDRVGRRGA